MSEHANKEDLEGLRREVMTYRQGVAAENERLRLEAEVGRVLNHYSRRAWVMGATGIVLIVLNLGDVARAYADNAWWDLLFWPSHHRPGSADGPPFHPFQIVGFLWQAGLLAYLWRWSALPDWLEDRIAHPESLDTKDGEGKLIDHLRKERER